MSPEDHQRGAPEGYQDLQDIPGTSVVVCNLPGAPFNPDISNVIKGYLELSAEKDLIPYYNYNNPPDIIIIDLDRMSFDKSGRSISQLLGIVDRRPDTVVIGYTINPGNYTQKEGQDPPELFSEIPVHHIISLYWDGECNQHTGNLKQVLGVKPI